MELKHFARLLVALLVVPAAIAVLLREPEASAISTSAEQQPVRSEPGNSASVDSARPVIAVTDQPVPLSEWAPGADLRADPVEDLSAESMAALREALLEGAVTLADLARDRPDALAALQQQGELDIVAEQRQRLEQTGLQLEGQHQDVSSQLADLEHALGSPAASNADWPEAERSRQALQALQADIEQAQRLISLERNQLERQHPQHQ